MTLSLCLFVITSWSAILGLYATETYVSVITAPTLVLDGIAITSTALALKAGTGLKALLTIGCFSAGTQIATPTGLRKIEDIKVGDLVLSYDEETAQIVAKPVTELIRNAPQVTYEVKVKSVGGMIDTVRATAEHPWLMASHQWAGTDELHVSDRVESATGEDLTVILIKVTGKVEPIYNFTVADTHTYLVGKNHAIVHNSCAKLGQRALEHIVERHWFTSGAQGAGKFAQGTSARNLKAMIGEASLNGTARNSGGRIVIEANLGRVIGANINGAASSSLRVVTDTSGNVITAFPF
ncbi:MAG: polymorphic toxin-type HINT domain-containing protein [Asticcacaulis sp.]